MIEKVRRRLVENKKDLLLQTLIIVSLFTISIVIRLYLREWFYSNLDLSVTIQDALYYSYNDPEAYTWEIFPDAQTYYVEYLDAFKYEQWDPYLLDRDFPLTGYVYGPIFVIGLVLVSVIIDIFFPSMTSIQRTWLSVTTAPLIFDSITTVFIYAILLKKKKDGKRDLVNTLFSIAGAIAFIFMPIVLFYNDTLYLNTYMFTTFTVISLYYLKNHKHRQSAIFLAIAILTKLNSLFLAPLWLVYVARNNLKEGVEFFLTLIFSYVLISFPWLVKSPIYYFGQQLWPGILDPHFGLEDTFILWPTTPFHAFLYWEQQTGSAFWGNLALFYYEANDKYIPLLVFVATCCVVMLLIGNQMKENKRILFSYSAMFVIGSHLFLARGNYKYYDPFFFPFVIIAITSWGEHLFANSHITIRKYNQNKLNRQIAKKKSDLSTRVSSFIDNENFKIIMQVLVTLLYIGVISWVFVLNYWIIFKVKWLHMFYLTLLAITIIATFNYQTHIAIINPENYKEVINFLKSEYHSFISAIKRFFKKIKREKEVVEDKEISEEKLS